MQSSSHHRPCRADARGSGTRQRTPKVAPPVLPPLRARYAPPAQSASRSTPTTMSARRFLATVSVWSVIYIILPCNQEYILYGRATEPSRPHEPLSSYERITAPYCTSFPSPLVSVRCGANPQLVHSPLRSPLTCAAFRIHLIAIRFTLIPCQFVTARIPLAASPVLPVVPYLRIVGHVVSPRFRLPPTRSGPCRCCATGTGRAGDRSPATRARSPRPWGSSQGR